MKPVEAGPFEAGQYEAGQFEAGLSAQRTGMAWRRTAVGAGAVALLAARPAAAGDADPVEILVAAAALAGWVALGAIAFRRGHGLRARPPVRGRRTVLAYAAVSVGFAVIGIMGVIVPLLSPGRSVP